MENILFIILSFIAIYIVLVLGNQRSGRRYRQYWVPIFAFLYAFAALYFYYEKTTEIGHLLGAFRAYIEIVYSLIAIGIFAIFKITFNEGGNIFRSKKVPTKAPRFSFAYTEDKHENVVLRRAFVFPELYLHYLRWWALIIFLLVLIMAMLAVEFQLKLPKLPAFGAFSLLVVLEMFWYLQHPIVEKQADAPIRKTTPEKSPDNYHALWEEYQEVWPEKLLLAWYYESKNYEPHTATSIQIIEAQNLINAGFKISVDDYHIINQLTVRTDMLIDDVVIDKIAPILFTIFLRRLMDGENILVLTPKRCYENSSYHAAVVEWIHEWFYKLTGNREFWKVQIFSKLKDVELNARIIVSSADDILEKNVVKHHWFENLRTILLLNGVEIFSESLTSNNILLNILKNKYSASNIQSIVLSDYCEALQDSVERNLNVRQNLSEQRQKRIPPKQSYTLFWKLEDRDFFQHRVLSGHIEKYLGAEAVLSLLARRERFENIELVGQEALPYNEYLEELDNSVNALRSEPVAPHQLKRKAVKDVGVSEVTFLLEDKEDTFILARDTDFNPITTLKKWESYADKHAFLHIVSPPYLFRNYFISNAAYFSKTPLYPLSAKMMISRFGVARTLLERMVTQELSEKEILEELVWINPNVIFVKQELHQLFKLAFSIDIVASKYLAVNSTYEFDKEDDRFKAMTKYRLLQQIKDNVNLSFLKNVEIVDRANNILKIISYDLLFQNYLPQQIHAFNGKPYRIRGYDRLNNKLTADYAASQGTIAYRPDLSVTLYHEQMEKPLTESHKKKLDSKLSIDLHEGRFDIETKGYFSFKKGIHIQNKNYTYTPLSHNDVPKRHYPLGRLALLTIQADGGLDIAKVTATLNILLTEALYSLFPQSHQYLIVGAPINELVLKGEFLKLFPSVKVANFEPSVSEDVVQLFIVEDTHQDLGLVQSIFDKWDYLFRIVDDYLYWLLNDANANKKTDKENEDFRLKSEAAKTVFLQYGGESLPDFLDLEGTAQLLRSLLGDNFITSQRMR